MFKRTITKLIEKLSISVEGRTSPQVVEILARMDAELAELKKDVKAIRSRESITPQK